MPAHGSPPRIVPFLALGLLTTVAIAWTSAWLPADPRSGFRLEQNAIAEGNALSAVSCHERTADRLEWTITLRGSPSESELLDMIGRIRLPWWWSIDPEIATLGADEPSVSQVLHARGWPLRALRCEWRSIKTGYSPDPIGGITLEPTSLPPDCVALRALPCHPIALGLIADTLFFALAWYAPWFMLSATRRTFRRRRGLCLRCAYNLSGLPPNSPCPECGHVVRTLGAIEGPPSRPAPTDSVQPPP